jgi:predicted ATPase
MLTGLQLRNFKSWDDTGSVRLAPLTVFFGRNSSGKSSLLQSMLLMKQTAESLDPRQVLNLGGADALVDLGTYHDIVLDHETNRDVQLAFDWKAADSAILGDTLFGPLISDDLGFTTSVGLEPDDVLLKEIIVKRMEYRIGADRDQTVGMSHIEGRSYKLFVGPNTVASRTVNYVPAPIKCFAFPDVAFKVFPDGEILAELSHQFDELMGSISYVGPLRSRPSRSYQWRGTRPSSVGPSGENTVAALLARSRQALTTGQDAASSDFHSMIGLWLKRIGVIDEFEIVELAAGTGLYEIRVRAPAGTTSVPIIDVGFGVSQVLPVLVQAFYAEPQSTVILEQPEIHLHPAAQSVLGDALLAAVKGNGVQLLVETHSEHLLHRIQRRIAEEQITKEDVALYFIETSQGRSEIHELKVDEYGNIANWPQDFFGDEMGDLAAMTEATAERRTRRR